MRHLISLASVLTALVLPGCTTEPTAEPEARVQASDHLDISSALAPDPCAALAAELAELLAAAQSCNVAVANPTQCASWVPAVGCAQPVAAAGSDATVKYLATFELYAQSCPLPDIACVDPTTLAVDCTQAADIDSLVGRCTIQK